MATNRATPGRWGTRQGDRPGSTIACQIQTAAPAPRAARRTACGPSSAPPGSPCCSRRWPCIECTCGGRCRGGRERRHSGRTGWPRGGGRWHHLLFFSDAAWLTTGARKQKRFFSLKGRGFVFGLPLDSFLWMREAYGVPKKRTRNV